MTLNDPGKGHFALVPLKHFLFSSNFISFSRKTNCLPINSQAPDVPEMAHQGIFQLSRLSVNCFVKTVKKYSLYFNHTDFMRVLSVPHDHCGTHNNFIKIFSRNYSLYGVYIFSNFGFRLNRLAVNDTKTHFYIS